MYNQLYLQSLNYFSIISATSSDYSDINLFLMKITKKVHLP